ncbi:MAG TPA: DUF222 domain-containing protein [Actinomycetota bacterium]|nr:DUF222 domain-containing protein [Actinomycetota bacterium]
MQEPHTSSDPELYDAIDEAQLVIAQAQRRQLRAIAEFDKRELWQHDGSFHMGHWLAQRLEITISEGLRMTNAAHVLERCTLLAHYLEEGRLSLDKVMQLARFITPETEEDLIRWARKVTLRSVRDRATLETRRPPEEAKSAHEARYLRFYPLDEIGSTGIDGRLPAEQGAMLAKTLEKIAERLVVPQASEHEDEETRREQANADALMELVLSRASAPGGSGSTDLPTLVIHTSIDALRGDRGSQIDDGPVLHPEVVRRIACDAKLRFVLDDANGNPVGIGFTSRQIPKWLRTEVMRRDKGCPFPGCGRKRFNHCHHIVPWPDGPTDLTNLIYPCTFHHVLLHEGGWDVELDDKQQTVWFRPDGTRYEPGLRITASHRNEDDNEDSDPDDRGEAPSARLALIAATFG